MNNPSIFRPRTLDSFRRFYNVTQPHVSLVNFSSKKRTGAANQIINSTDGVVRQGNQKSLPNSLRIRRSSSEAVERCLGAKIMEFHHPLQFRRFAASKKRLSKNANQSDSAAAAILIESNAIALICPLQSD